MKQKTELEIATLEERIKDLQFKVKDAQWTLDHTPQEIAELEARIQELKDAACPKKQPKGQYESCPELMGHIRELRGD